MLFTISRLPENRLVFDKTETNHILGGSDVVQNILYLFLSRNICLNAAGLSDAAMFIIQKVFENSFRAEAYLEV